MKNKKTVTKTKPKNGVSKTTSKKKVTKKEPLKPIMERVFTYEDACKVKKLNPKKVPIVRHISRELRKLIVATYKLAILAEVLNEKKEPNYTDGSWKYFPWAEIKADSKRPSGFGFSGAYFDNWFTITAAPSRLSYRNSDLARHALKHNPEIFMDWFLYHR